MATAAAAGCAWAGDVSDAKHLEIHQIKELKGGPGAREQAVHADSYLHLLVLIIHLNHETVRATEISRGPYSPASLDEDGNPTPDCWSLPWSVERKDFHQLMAGLGDVMLFATDKRHRAPANESKTGAGAATADVTRRVLFVALGPPISRGDGDMGVQRYDDEDNVYEFQHAFRLHGFGSKQHLDALRKYDDPITRDDPTPYDPLQHYQGREKAKLRALLGPKRTD